MKAALIALSASSALACTTIIAGKAATVDGSVLVSHSNDGEGGSDPRLVRIPAQNHASGTNRPIFFAPENYPRYVGSARGNVPAYVASGNQTDFAPIGHIDEVEHTYSYFEETYGCLNEHQLGIGESTCSGVFGTKPAGQGGKALMSVDTLTQIAMERTTTSRAAVQLMGSLAVKYGFYGAGSFEGTAESLLVSDVSEGWIFHILPDDTGASAIWAAQRVPDDHVAVVANAFVIREVNFTDSANFLGSASVHSVAQKKGWWSPDKGLLDFTAIYSDGEYAHKFYSGRRMWGVYNLLAPSLKLSPEYDEYRKSKPYPVSLKPDKKVSVADVAHAMRSYYEGTQFDQTVTHAAGPWGTPDHVYGGSAGGKVKGNWERTIGLYRTSDSFIVQSRAWLPASVGGVLWWGPHAAPYTAYVPLAAGMGALPDCTLGHPAALSKPTLFWAVRYLANCARTVPPPTQPAAAASARPRFGVMACARPVRLSRGALGSCVLTDAQLKRNHMITEIDAYQSKQHTAGLALVASVDAKANGTSPATLQADFSAHANKVLADLWALSDALMFKYADGYINTINAKGELHVASESYPDWWLNEVDYKDGPPPVPPKLMEWV